MRRTIPFIGALGLTLALVASPAEATSGTMTITTDTTLTEDQVGSIVVDADDITLDCAGFTVFGPDLDRGISVDGHDGVTVKNCLVTGFGGGIVVLHGSGNTVRANSTYANNGAGIIIQTGASRTRVIENRSDNNGTWGFQLGVSTGNTYRHNEASGNIGGFAWDRGSRDLVIRNVARRNEGFGFGMSSSSHMTFRYNVARGNDQAGFGVDTATGMTFRENIARGNGGTGFGLAGIHRSVIEANTSVRNFRGFLLFEADHNVLRSNVAKSNGQAQDGSGFETAKSDDNLFKQNRATRNFRGFVLWMESNDNTYVRNWACHNQFLDASDDESGTGNVWRGNHFCNASL